MNKLGWHWWPSDTSVATTEYDGRAPCINLGHCTPACTQGAKASTDITYWPHAIRAGVELRTRCRVREITTNEHGMASGVIYYDADGRGAVPAGRGRHPGLQRRRHATPAAQFGIGAISERAGQFQRSGRQESDVPSVCAGPRLCRRTARRQSRRRRCACGARSSTRPIRRAASSAAIRFQFGRGIGAGHRGDLQPGRRPPALGRGPSPRVSQTGGPSHRHVGDLRGPAGGAQPGHARSGAEGRARHPGAEDRLYASARTRGA